jgi:hypothetical protein
MKGTRKMSAHQTVRVARLLAEQARATHLSIKKHPALSDDPDRYWRIVMRSSDRIARRVRAWDAAMHKMLDEEINR